MTSLLQHGLSFCIIEFAQCYQNEKHPYPVVLTRPTSGRYTGRNMNSLPGNYDQRTIELDDAPDAFRQSLAAANASQGTVRAYLDDVEQFIAWFKEQSVLERADQVQRQDIEGFLAYLGQKGVTGTSRRRKLCALRRLFVSLRDNGLVPNDPTAGIQRPKAEERTPQILYGHEYKALLYEARNNIRDQAILQAFLQTGIRVGELCSLTLDDIDLKARELTVRQGKGLKDRVIPITEEASQTVERYMATRDACATPHIFLTKYGTRLDPRACNYMLGKHVRRAGIRKHISAHTLRHTMATHRADKGMPLRSLQAMLGHKSMETTYRYIHLARASLRQEIEATAL